MGQITTTFALIKEAGACEEGYRKLAKSLGGITKYGKDTPITWRQIIDSNGLNDALWCLRTVKGHDALLRHYAVDCAERVRHLMTDKRSTDALNVARRFAQGQATKEERAAAGEAAWDAARAAARAAAWDAAWDAARAAAGDAARAAARAAAGDAAGEAAWDVARAAAWAAAGDAARAAARAAVKQWQAARLANLMDAGEWTPVEEGK